jgi:DNA-binding transcriptional ArsR family regulator
MDPQINEIEPPDDQRLIQALAHPLRARLFEEIGQRPLSLSELATALGVSQSKAAYHSCVLESVGGLVRDDEDGALTIAR